MHISNQKKTRNIPKIAFQSWALQVSWFHNQRSSILFDLQTFLVSGHLLDFNESVFEMEEQSKKTLFFLSSLCLKKKNSFSLFFFLLSMSPNDYLPNSLGSYEKLVKLRFFNELEEGPNRSI